MGKDKEKKKEKEKEKKSMATTSQEENRGEHSSSSSIVILQEDGINDPDKKLADSILAKLSIAGSSTPKSNQLSIYRVHKKFRKIDKFVYRPEMVSIGPFHYKERSLPKMDEHKLRYVNDYFSRTSSSTTTAAAAIHECVASLRDMLDEARKCYSENFFGDQDSDNDDDDDQLDVNEKKKNKNKNKNKNKKKRNNKLHDDDKFIKMMLLDGLFIIELFRKSFAQQMKWESGSSQSQEEEKDDLVFSNIWRKPSLIRDMILLGNQLPMFVLEYLFTMSTTTTNVVNDTSPSCSLTMLALHFFNPLMSRREEVLDQYSECKGMHLLDLFKKTFQVQLDVLKLQPAGASDTLANNSETTTTNQSKFIPSVTELRVAGVRFDISESDSFLHIEFDSANGVMKIPRVVIHEQMDSLMSNLIAAEQCYDGRANNYSYMTSYAFLMDSLLNSPKDVEFLCGRGIIVRYLNKDEDVSNLFTKLCTEVTLTNFYYSELCDKVNAYYKTHWKVWRAAWLETAKREFFNNPWTIFAFFAAALVIFLTLLQTIFTILSFYQQRAPSMHAVRQNPKPPMP